MSTKIEWTDESWNPVIGCSKVSEGCLNCYAEKMAYRLCSIENARFGEIMQDAPSNSIFGRKYNSGVVNEKGWTGQIFCDGSILDKPLHWKKPRRISVDSMGDLFHKSVPFEFIDKVEDVICQTPQHTYQILTKRPRRMAKYFSEKFWPFTNIWLGVTAENQKCADERIPILLEIPAAKRFVSLEPLLEAVNLEYIKDFQYPNRFMKYERVYSLSGERSMLGHKVTNNKLDWVIIGCESGANRRECKIEWVRDIVEQCKEAGVPVFVKQLSINGKVSKNPAEWPEDLRIRKFPR